MKKINDNKKSVRWTLLRLITKGEKGKRWEASDTKTELNVRALENSDRGHRKLGVRNELS